MTFLKSCSSLADLPASGPPELALMGRSNVGKSSLLNALAGAPIARVSRTPGRTRLLNLFSVDEGTLLLVDCPGYGYARASRSLRQAWGDLTQQYLESRHPRCLLLVDATLAPQAIDLAATTWLRDQGITFGMVATKCDRLSGNERPLALRRLEDGFGITPLPFSSKTGMGREELRATVLR